MSQSKPKTLKVQNLPFPPGRIIAIGDVHGCIDELQELYDKLQPNKTDIVICLGDLVDRGPDSEGVVQFVKDHDIFTIQSNHDEKVIRYHQHVLKQIGTPSYKIPMRVPSSYMALSNSSIDFLTSAPHAIVMPNENTNEPYQMVFCHAGMGPGGLHQDPSAFIRNRYFVKNSHDNKLTPVKSVEIDGIWYVPEGSYPWHYFWDGRWTIVYGHSVNLEPLIENNTIGIDAGCVFGGCLRAYIKDVKNGLCYFVDVKAKKVYSA